METVWTVLGVAWTIVSTIFAWAFAAGTSVGTALSPWLPNGFAFLLGLLVFGFVLVLPLAVLQVAREGRRGLSLFWFLVWWDDLQIRRAQRGRRRRPEPGKWHRAPEGSDHEWEWWPGDDGDIRWTTQDDESPHPLSDAIDGITAERTIKEEMLDELRASAEWSTLTDEHEPLTARRRAWKRLSQRFHPDKWKAEGPDFEAAANHCQSEVTTIYHAAVQDWTDQRR